MPTEREVVQSGSSSIPPCGDSLPGRAGGESEPHPGNGNTLLEITIDRDLAVQLVGSDAGKARRMRPHDAMTKGSSSRGRPLPRPHPSRRSACGSPPPWS
jgi:hypothetical protein